MKYIWSYLLVGFCMGLTSARVMDFPGNRNGIQDNLDSGVKDEKVRTPPTTSGLIIDSNGYPGNSNVENIQVEELPPFFSKVLTAFFEQNKQSTDHKIVPFSKEDILNMENSPLCKMMCESGVRKPPCKCE